MNYVKRTENGMLCEYCDEVVPDKAKGLFKCFKCNAKYCSKEHQKANSRYHHRRCTALDQPANNSVTTLPVPLSARLRDNQFTSFGNAGIFCSDVSKQTLNIAEYVVDSLIKNGHCILDTFHGQSLANAILNDVKTLHQGGSFTDGQLLSVSGHGTSNRKIREDEITWVSGTESGCGAISHHMSTLDTLVFLCNGFIKEHEIRHRSQAMVACYPGKGTGYKRHVDNPNKDGRCITTLYYLNPGWNAETDGGILKLMPDQSFFPDCNQKEVDIEPVMDRLLLFWSDKRNPHEVQPAYKTRYAITLWYFDTEERRKFFEELKLGQKTKDEVKNSGVLKDSQPENQTVQSKQQQSSHSN